MLVQERARDRVLGLEHVPGLEDHALVALRDHRSDPVVVVRDNFLTVHENLLVSLSDGTCEGGNPVRLVGVETGGRVAAG